MAQQKVIVIPDGKICDYIDGKFRNDTPEEYIRQTIEKRLVNEHKYVPEQVRIEYTLQLGSRKPRADIVIFDKRNNYVVNRIKPDNEQIYYIIDAINDAINAGKQISFQYYDYTGLKKKVLKNKGEIYKLSPYKLLWCGDYYYVLGYSEKKSKVINFRVDRIASKPEILDKDIIPMPDDFDIENYTKEVFFMFSGEKVLVDLRCDNSLMKTMVDRFGEDVTTLAYDMTSFRVQTDDFTSR